MTEAEVGGGQQVQAKDGQKQGRGSTGPPRSLWRGHCLPVPDFDFGSPNREGNFLMF